MDPAQRSLNQSQTTTDFTDFTDGYQAMNSRERRKQKGKALEFEKRFNHGLPRRTRIEVRDSPIFPLHQKVSQFRIARARFGTGSPSGEGGKSGCHGLLSVSSWAIRD